MRICAECGMKADWVCTCHACKPALDRLERLEAALVKFAEGLSGPWVDAHIRAHAKGFLATLNRSEIICAETLDDDMRCAKCGWNGRTQDYDKAEG